jgi:hypothetical protein
VQNEPNLALSEGRCAKRTQFRPTGGRSRAGLPRSGTACRGNLRRAEARKTKPISGRRWAPRGESCETNPIPGGAGWNVAPRAWAERQVRKTNPISPARPGMGAGWRGRLPRRSAIVQNEANLPRRACSVPVRALRRVRAGCSACGILRERLTASLQTGQNVQNKPNFLAVPGRPPSGLGPTKPIVRNEANLRGRSAAGRRPDPTPGVAERKTLAFCGRFTYCRHSAGGTRGGADEERSSV